MQAEIDRSFAPDSADWGRRPVDNLAGMEEKGGDRRAKPGVALEPAAMLAELASPCIGDALRRARLPHWIEAAQDWVQRFAGIDRVAHADEIAPVRCVTKLARRYARLSSVPSDAQVAHDMARLPFTRWHARWPAWATPDGVNRTWRPLEETFRGFAARHDAADELVVWEGTVPVVAPDAATAHLLAQVGPAKTGAAG